MAEAVPEIGFHSENARFVLRDKTKLRHWLARVARRHRKTIGPLRYVFVTDKFLLQLNQRHLRHDTYTDIITFDYSADQPANTVSGEIYISVERVKENAKTYKVPERDELHRVMAHGLLHLCGFGDKTSVQAKRMRAEEEKALALRS